MPPFTGRTALVTGASTGIGRAAAWSWPEPPPSAVRVGVR